MVNGGSANTVRGQYSTVGGGNANRAISSYAVVAGGYRNKASGRFAAVSGGSKNTAAGRFSFVRGYMAKVTSDYSAAISLTEDGCEVRDGGTFGICATAFTITTSANKVYDVSTLLGTTRRALDDHSAAAEAIAAADEDVRAALKTQESRAVEIADMPVDVEAATKRALAVAAALDKLAL